MTFKANNFAVIFQGKNLTIKNGKFDANGGSYGLFVGDEGVTQNVLIEDITIAGGINVYNASDVLLRNVNITGTNYYAVWCDEAGQVTIESGNFQSNGNAVLGLTTNDSKLDVSGGIFNANNKPLVLTNGNNYGTPTLTGGSYDTNPLTYTEPAAVVITDSNMQYHIGKAAKEAMQQGGYLADHLGYLTRTKDGKILKSSTIYLRDDTGKIRYILAINFDITGLLMFDSSLKSLLSTAETPAEKEPERIVQSVGELLDELIEESVKRVGKPVALMTKEDKIRAIQFLNKSGAFLITKSGDKISKYYGISKYTLYSYIDAET